MLVNEESFALKRLEDVFFTLTNLGSDIEDYLFKRKKKSIKKQKLKFFNHFSTFIFNTIFLLIIFLLIIYLYYNFIFVRKFSNFFCFNFYLNPLFFS